MLNYQRVYDITIRYDPHFFEGPEKRLPMTKGGARLWALRAGAEILGAAEVYVYIYIIHIWYTYDIYII